MPTPSPLASLVATLAAVCQQAQQHQSLLSKNEAATRAALIDPVLRALGWDTADVAMVVPEKTINTAWRADYALFGKEGTIELLVEAKCLGSDLEKYSTVQQLLSYAFGFGVVKVLITDGINWHFYNDFKPGNALAESHFSLLQAPIAQSALHLVQWLDATQFGHGLPSTAASPVVIAESTMPSGKTSKPAKPLKQSRQLTSTFIDLSQVNTLTLPPGQKPKLLRLPDGTQKPIQNWKDILLEVCRFLLVHNKNLVLPLPDKAGKKRFLLTSEKPLVGSSTPASYQGKSLFIYTHYSATDCIANALCAEAQLPADARRMKVAVAF